jgi:hypothetical protein
MEAHHFGTRGVGQKCSDYRTVPLCEAHHREFHDTGRIDPLSHEATRHLFIECQVSLLVEWLEPPEVA